MVQEWRLLRAELTTFSLPSERQTTGTAPQPANEANIAQLQPLPPTHLFFLGTFHDPQPAEANPELPVDFPDDELQAMLKRRGLPASGNKVELVRRLAQADAAEMWTAVGDLTLLGFTPWA